jgi:hypothetical protein
VSWADGVNTVDRDVDAATDDRIEQFLRAPGELVVYPDEMRPQGRTARLAGLASNCRDSRASGQLRILRPASSMCAMLSPGMNLIQGRGANADLRP